MSISTSIIERISALIEEGTPISTVGKRGYGLTDEEQQHAEGWLTSAAHLVNLLIADPLSPYRQKCLNVVTRSQIKIGPRSGVEPDDVNGMIGVLRSLLKDVDAGLVSSLANRVRAEVFDDFLDHAEAYLKSGRKKSGAIAGVVFEDTVRRLGQKYQASDTSLDLIISNLVKKQVFTDVKAKRARSAADERTKATHAKWNEFDLSDVNNCIGFTRELITTHLD